MGEERCKSCKFWYRDGADGLCKKNSPRPTVMEQGRVYTIVWPKLKPDESACGDYELFVVGGIS